MTVIHFEPLDTLFFRDGRPYHQGEQNQAGVRSLFPPAPSTLVGAVRAACARAMGWTGGGWSEDVRERLGDGSNLGPLCFRGPAVARNGESLFPAPAHLMGRPDGKEKPTPATLTRLFPGLGAMCDLGPSALLPAADSATEGAKLLGEQGWWMTARGLGAVLRGDLPEPACMIHHDDLWEREPRVGIVRSETTRTTGEGALYSPTHIRLRPGVTLAMEARGLPHECVDALPVRPQPVGGEARACWLSLDDGPLPLPDPPDLRITGDVLRYAVVVLTPADTGTPPHPGEQDYAGLPGRVVSACLPRPTCIGGWDSQAMEPLALRPHLAPGSVLFLETPRDAVGEVEALHGAAIGKRMNWGFGMIVVGLWGDRNDRTVERPQ